ncbi:hypothetical protein [Olivibacter domesticus]|uniref:Uncharacterized protein n=1 Tax=Olivibacter domesticus TaxID=407022 RepID=A0A1H7KJQ0_OLID1|nr:hypothetical protein [Olivibacter domesticus]SEK87029.1 hypothetical protein SAMN05661044_01378 [Olivibacter domesticus]
MKVIFATLITLATSSLASYSQNIQKKTFQVNACRFFGEFETPLESLCDPFEVVITGQYINIGDTYDLEVEKILFDHPAKGEMTFLVKDPAKQIKSIALGSTARSGNFIQLTFIEEQAGEAQTGIIFQYWDYVSSYDFWRYQRRIK